MTRATRSRRGLAPLVMTSLMVLTACSGGSTPSATRQPSVTATVSPPSASVAPTASAEPSPLAAASITYWNLPFPVREEIEKALIAEFETANPGVKVTYELGPADDVQFITKVVTAYAGGGGPDCFNALNLGIGTLFEQGSLEPVDPRAFGAADVAELESRYLSGTLEGLKYKGTLYGIPTETSNYALFVNTAAFTDAGLDPTTQVPATWEDLFAIAPMLTEKEGASTVKRAFDFQSGQPDDPTATGAALTLAGMAAQLGGTVLSPEGTSGTINTEPWVRVFSLIRDWNQQGYSDPALTSSFAGFQDGSVAMAVAGSWYAGVLKDASSPVLSTYRAAPLPRFRDAINDSGALGYAYGIVINAKASPENKAACQALSAALTSQPVEYLEKTGLLQPTNELLESGAIDDVPNLDVFVDDLGRTGFFPVHSKTFEMFDVITRALQRVITQDQDVQASLDEANAELNRLLTE